MKTNAKKIINNSILSIIASMILSLLLSLQEMETNTILVIGAVIFVFFFIVSTFYGDKGFNITGNWPIRLKQIKNIIGSILFGVLMAGASLFIFGLVSILIGVDNILIGASFTIIFLFVFVANFWSLKEK